MALSNKQKAFIEHYLRCWNSAEAARRAGYSVKTARIIGAQNLSKLNIKEAIDARIAELKMSADEVLIRLAEQARGDLGDFVHIDLKEQLKEHPKSYLVKKLTTEVYQTKDGNVHHKTNFELYDAQAALAQLGKALGIFTDPGSSEDKPFIIKVIYGDRANGAIAPATPETG